MSTRVIGVSLEQAQEFKRDLQRLAADARENAVVAAAAAMAAPVLPAIKDRAPILKEPDPRRVAGNLKSKISAWASKIEPGKVTWQVGFNAQSLRVGKLAAFYALWVEFGTRKMEAIPFIRPGFDASAGEAAKRGIDAFRRFLAAWGAA